jgi:hypothetical protein
MFEWCCAGIPNPYLTEQKLGITSEEKEKRADAFPVWLRRELVLLIEESAPGLFALLIRKRPELYYSSEAVRDFVWRDSAYRSHYTRVIASDFLGLLERLPESQYLSALDSYFESLGSPYELFADDSAYDVTRFSDTLFLLSEDQALRFDTTIRRRIVELWAMRNSEMWNGMRGRSGMLSVLLREQLREHAPRIHDRLGDQLAKEGAGQLREYRELALQRRSTSSGTELAELNQHIEAVSYAIGELDLIRDCFQFSVRSRHLSDVAKFCCEGN